MRDVGRVGSYGDVIGSQAGLRAKCDYGVCMRGADCEQVFVVLVCAGLIRGGQNFGRPLAMTPVVAGQRSKYIGQPHQGGREPRPNWVTKIYRHPSRPRTTAWASPSPSSVT